MASTEYGHIVNAGDHLGYLTNGIPFVEVRHYTTGQSGGVAVSNGLHLHFHPGMTWNPSSFLQFLAVVSFISAITLFGLLVAIGVSIRSSLLTPVFT